METAKATKTSKLQAFLDSSKSAQLEQSLVAKDHNGKTFYKTLFFSGLTAGFILLYIIFGSAAGIRYMAIADPAVLTFTTEQRAVIGIAALSTGILTLPWFYFLILASEVARVFTHMKTRITNHASFLWASISYAVLLSTIITSLIGIFTAIILIH